ncbi:MAG: hypothetical protein DRQ88_00215 [Epsilonproteobacteria bacterium]|nr:MAG: hypothetical protein DRQ89_06140 [Campylobacterota bacterium]RLA68060.1 MAG: hypothetical protein DRQ88_00215 [Campylobacterota bacterium]
MNIFLNLVFVCTLSFYSFATFGVSVQDIEQEFKQRSMDDAGFESMLNLEAMGLEIFNSEDLSDQIRARGALTACRAKNFRGEYLPVSRAERKIEFHEGSQHCKKGIKLLEQDLGEPKNSEDREVLADLYFWYTTVFGRWFEDESKFSALKYWKNEVKPILESLIEQMEMGKMLGWGPYRALGRAYYSIPAGKSKSLRFMKKAYMKSRSKTFKVSVYPLNTVYYAESLIAKGKAEEAKVILEKTLTLAEDEEKLRALNAEAEKLYGDYRWFETLHEIEMCREVLQSLK